MKRYFEVIDKKQTLQIDVVIGSEAQTASVEKVGKAFGLNLREIEQAEYKKLTRTYKK